VEQAGRVAKQLSEAGAHADRPGPTNGHWADADWLYCRDDKWRPVEPGTFPLAHGATARVGRLRAYGNAIVPQVAEAVIRAYMQ
jgi:DNA (cytosine-5)-methyltransferase 1